MTFRPYTALGERHTRLPEQGRIRLGIQAQTAGGKSFPKSIDTLRFTSPRQGDVAAVAEVLGGEVKSWTNVRNQEWEVITNVSEVQVVLPRDALGGTPLYELWSGGGLERRCDGESCAIPQKVGEDIEIVDVPCLCNAKQQAQCKVVVRLSVILPQVRFGGTWRLETHSWTAADELPGMVAAIESFTNRHGFVRAFLGIRKESKIENGKTSRWVVPYLRMDESVDQVLAGAGAVAAIATRSATPSDMIADVGWTDAGYAEGYPNDHVGDQSDGVEAANPSDHRFDTAAQGMAALGFDAEVVEAEIVHNNDTTQPLGRVAKRMGLDDDALQQSLWAAIRSKNPGISDRELTGKVVTVLARADLGTHNLVFKDDGSLVQVKVNNQ